LSDFCGGGFNGACICGVNHCLVHLLHRFVYALASGLGAFSGFFADLAYLLLLLV